MGLCCIHTAREWDRDPDKYRDWLYEAVHVIGYFWPFHQSRSQYRSWCRVVSTHHNRCELRHNLACFDNSYRRDFIIPMTWWTDTCGCWGGCWSGGMWWWCCCCCCCCCCASSGNGWLGGVWFCPRFGIGANGHLFRTSIELNCILFWNTCSFPSLNIRFLVGTQPKYSEMVQFLLQLDNIACKSLPATITLLSQFCKHKQHSKLTWWSKELPGQQLQEPTERRVLL